MREDLHYALRLFARRPGVITLIVATLAIGIAASTIVFSVADAILWHPLPFRDPDRLVALWVYNPAQKTRARAIPPAALTAWGAKTQIFDTVHAYGLDSRLLTGGGDAQAVTGGFISVGLFAALGIHPRVGRDLTAMDYRPDADEAVLLSDGLWRSRFGAAADLIGRPIMIDGRQHTVVGVMPPGFSFPVDSVRLWVPLARDAVPSRVNALARLRFDVPFAKAQAFAEATTHGLIGPGGRALPELRVMPFTRLDARTTAAVVALLGAVSLLMLIAVGNATNVLLAEAVRRDAEMAVRTSLGASTVRLAQQVITETLLLTTAAGAIGVALASAGLRLIVAGLPWVMSFQALRPIAVNWRALLFASATATLVGLGTALAPISRAWCAGLQSSLKGAALATTSRNRLRSALVVLQLAVTMVLLVAGGLLANGFVRMNRADLGFSPAHLVTMSVDLPPAVLANEQAKIGFLEEWRRRTALVPGVLAATVTAGAMPPNTSFDVAAIETSDRGVVAGPDTAVAVGEVDGTFFSTLEIPLLTGRTFDDRDRLGGDPVAIVSRALAERLWPHGAALGRQFRIDGVDARWHTVIGIAGNVSNGSFEQPLGDLAVYHARSQGASHWRFQSIIARTANQPVDLEKSLREILRVLNPDIPVTEVETGEEAVAGANARVRFATFLMWGLAAAAAALALIGVYGAFWYSVRQRTREIGVRIALGGQPTAMIRMVLRETAVLAIAAIGVGAPVAYASARLLRSLLFGVEPSDAATFSVASVLLVGTALAASYLPALRAGQINPSEALRSQ